MENSPKFAVFGGGSWATAIVKMLCENLDQVGWYMRNIDAIEHIKKTAAQPKLS
jgi:glycerol-3-phosphate dehydrogenase (NAD(P)+)